MYTPAIAKINIFMREQVVIPCFRLKAYAVITKSGFVFFLL